MPLGIVLAAGWLAMLSLDEIAAEIARSIDFLAGDMSDLPEQRQRSIRARSSITHGICCATTKNCLHEIKRLSRRAYPRSRRNCRQYSLRLLVGLINKSLIRRGGNHQALQRP